MQRPLLVSADSDLIDDVLRLAAANAVEVHLATDAEGARARWPSAPLVLVGADAAATVASARLARRAHVVLVSRGQDATLWPAAVAIGADQVASLPADERTLVDRIADGAEGQGREGRVLAVIGAGGGSGASTFASTLALAAAATGMAVLLVDGDPLGGGLDVMLGLEHAAGVRWADLLATRGRLASASLADALPRCGDVAVVSWGRDGSAAVPAEAMSAVLDAGVRGFDLVVVDLARRLDAVGELVTARAGRTVVVTSNRVRAASATAQLVVLLNAHGADACLAVRSEPRGLLDDAVADCVGLPLLARLPTSAAVAARADEGEPPSLRDAFGRACQAALGALARELGTAA